jgi:hypothetical protein
MINVRLIIVANRPVMYRMLTAFFRVAKRKPRILGRLTMR